MYHPEGVAVRMLGVESMLIINGSTCYPHQARRLFVFLLRWQQMRDALTKKQIP